MVKTACTEREREREREREGRACTLTHFVPYLVEHRYNYRHDELSGQWNTSGVKHSNDGALQGGICTWWNTETVDHKHGGI